MIPCITLRFFFSSFDLFQAFDDPGLFFAGLKD